MAAKLERELGLFETVFYGVGIILGAGIYVLIGKAAGLAGNMAWAAFLIGSLIAAFTGLSYAELSSMFPKAGGEYVYTEKAFNRRLAFLVGWLIIIGGVIASATVTLGFSGYLKALYNIPIIASALALVAILSLINWIGIKESALFNVVFTAIEAGGLILIVWISRKFIGTVDYFQLPDTGFLGVTASAALIFFAYLGFEDLVRLSEETKNPTRTIPRALIISIIITTILYILVAIAAVSVMSPAALADSSAPLADIAATALGPDAFYLLSVIALFATANTVLILLIATSRLMYGMACDKAIPIKALARVHKKTHTPTLAIILTAVVTGGFVFLRDVTFVASLTDIALFLTFLTVNLALIWLRYKMPTKRRPFKSPINIGNFSVLAALGVASSFLMLLHFTKNLLLIGIGLVLLGLFVGEICIKWQKR
jgi:APA family basic amino acid/polyamine antiporter